MKKVLVSIGAILAIAVLGFVINISTTSKDPFSKEELPKSEEKAKKATIAYFKDKKNTDVVIDLVSTVGELGPSEMILDGHVVGNENQKIIATVRFESTKIVKVSGEISK